MLIFGKFEYCGKYQIIFVYYLMKDLGEGNMILKVKVIRSDDDIVAQKHYVKKLLKKFEYFEVTSVIIFYDANSKFKKIYGNSVSQSKYA